MVGVRAIGELLQRSQPADVYQREIFINYASSVYNPFIQPPERNYLTMTTQILTTIKQGLETPNREFLVFRQLDPTYMPSTMEEMLVITRIHFVAPDGYLRVVMPTALPESAVSWIRTEFNLLVKNTRPRLRTSLSPPLLPLP
ncbi:hypothetical protein HOY80DRAFT_612105 [Tuber brumale]|nr:hypothetical protein HOY80DRAFT_612105 [Tuber brumale]